MCLKWCLAQSKHYASVHYIYYSYCDDERWARTEKKKKKKLLAKKPYEMYQGTNMWKAVDLGDNR